MHKFFVERGAKALPFVEVYRGSELIEAQTIPPAGVEIFSAAVGKALEAAERIREQMREVNFLAPLTQFSRHFHRLV